MNFHFNDCSTENVQIQSFQYSFTTCCDEFQELLKLNTTTTQLLITDLNMFLPIYDGLLLACGGQVERTLTWSRNTCIF